MAGEEKANPVTWAIALAILIVFGLVAIRAARSCEPSSFELLNYLKITLGGCQAASSGERTKPVAATAPTAHTSPLVLPPTVVMRDRPIHAVNDHLRITLKYEPAEATRVRLLDTPDDLEKAKALRPALHIEATSESLRNFYGDRSPSSFLSREIRWDVRVGERNTFEYCNRRYYLHVDELATQAENATISITRTDDPPSGDRIAGCG